MELKDLASLIMEKVGGVSNVEKLTHCVTRLRFVLKDVDKAQSDELKATDGVMGVVYKGGQYQLIIGPTVGDLYDMILSLYPDLGKTEEKEEVKAKEEKKGIKAVLNTVLDVFISSFTPLIPMIAGGGMIKVLCAVLLNLKVLPSTSSTYAILNFIGDAIFYFLPIFVGYTSAKKMDVDPFLGMVLGAILVHPNFAALATKTSNYTSFLGMPVRIVTYSTQALPVILTVWFAKYVDKFSNKICPNLVKVFLRPMITLLIVAPIMLIVIGPLGTILGDYFQIFCNIMNHWGWIAVGLNAAIFPLLVLTGMHNALIPLMITMFATQGFDAVLVPSGLVANIAEGAAAFGVALRTKNKKVKGTALSATVSALCGITEPALYGVNLRLKKPFIAMLIGSLIGGCFAGLFGVTAYSFVSPSILSLPIFAGGTGGSFIWAIITVIFTFLETALITYFFGFEDVKEESDSSIEDHVSLSQPSLESESL